MKVIIHADGSSRGNPGAGGYAALLQQVDRSGAVVYEKEVVGMRPNVTNNQMELRAAIAGLQALKQPCAIELRLDSQYVLGALQGNAARANRELVHRLRALAATHEITLTKVEGHAGIAENERVDRLAREQAGRLRARLDVGTRVAVAGSRTFDDFDRTIRTLDRMLARLAGQGSVAITSGQARGADRLGEDYATLRGYPVIPLPAEWEIFGKVAGYRRNEEVLAVATHVVVFWQNRSPGSAHLVRQAEQAGLPLRMIEVESNLLPVEEKHSSVAR